MKRRAFIQLMGASALGLPFLSGQLGSSGWKTKGELTADKARKPLRLDFGADETGVISVLRRHSTGVYLLGGGVLGKVAGTDLPYLNLLTESKAFGKIKQDLFAFGVAPVSTPEMPENFIRFAYQSKAYSVFCLGLEDFLKQNALGREVPLIPLAHNFLVYSIDGAWAIDPYGALGGGQRRGKGCRAKLVLEPGSSVAGLECCLSTAFDTALLGLELPAGHAALERRVLAARASKDDAPVLIHYLINYFPDLLEIRGYDLRGAISVRRSASRPRRSDRVSTSARPAPPSRRRGRAASRSPASSCSGSSTMSSARRATSRLWAPGFRITWRPSGCPSAAKISWPKHWTAAARPESEAQIFRAGNASPARNGI